MQDHFRNHATNLSLEARRKIAEGRSTEHIKMIAKTRSIAVAVENNQIVGMGALKENEIRHMYVQARFQRRNIGSRLLEFLITQAKDSGLNTVFVNSVVEAKRFYEKNGFFLSKMTQIERHGVILEAMLLKKDLK
jgi:N-acetylglutamate synthase-like GNAT family acetyltransferase